MDDREIIDRIRKGDKQSFEGIIRKYNQRLYRLGKGILNDDDEVEDAMQEAYIKAYRNLSSFEEKSAFSTWLSRILINECLMQLRKKKNLVRLYDEPESSFTLYQANPEQKAMNEELKKAIEHAISTLPEKYRLVFILREIEHASVAETCEILQLSESNVKVRLNRAKEMLRDALMTNYSASELYEFNLVKCDDIVINVMMRI